MMQRVYARKFLNLAAVAVIGLSGCQNATPNGASSTIALLHKGSERACVASDVQDDLKGLILPKVNEVGGTAPEEDKQKALSSLSLSFDATTLQSIDKSVSKASCTTMVRATGGGQSNQFRLAYEVSPSAEDANAVVVESDADDVRTFVNTLVVSALEQSETQRDNEQQQADAAQARQQLLATVTPRWLVGAWIETNSNASGCADGHAMLFQPNHALSGASINGRWTLTEDHLHAIGQAANGPVNIDGTVTAADPLSFTLNTSDGDKLSLRRCTADEMNAPVDAAPDAPEQTTAPDQQ